MKKIYLDTNIFDYVALRHPVYGTACKLILDDVGVHLDATCSYLVPIEILGSLSQYSTKMAADALTAFFSFDLKVVDITERLMRDASDITKETGVSGYDAVHASAMKSEGIDTIITENYKDFGKIKWLELVRPLEYAKWKTTSEGQ